MPDWSPEEIIRYSQAGNRTAFALLVRQYYPAAYGLSVRLLGNAPDAEDVVQEVFLRIWRNLQGFDPSTRFGTWMYRIVMNRCLDHLRQRSRRARHETRPPADDEAPEPRGTVTPESAASGNDLLRIIHGLVAGLPETQRLIFTLRDLQDLSIEEVMDITGLSSESVRTNLHYARRRIRERLEKEYAVKGSAL